MKTKPKPKARYLCLTRQKGESILIEDIEVITSMVKPGSCRITIRAPSNVHVKREELLTGGPEDWEDRPSHRRGGQLVLTRKEGQRIVFRVGDTLVYLAVLDIRKGTSVRFGINAPPEMRVARNEIREAFGL